jgi:hypothetical protein
MSVCLVLSNKISDDSWKDKIPPIDGFGTEGIGSMLQYHLLLNFFADFIGVEFTYPGSENFAHHSYTEYSKEEYFKMIDSFFNFPNLNGGWDQVITMSEINDSLVSFINENKNNDKKILINLYNCHRELASLCGHYMTEIFTKERIDKIRNNLYFSGERYFDENINISLHIRTANPDDIPAEIVSTYREKYIFEKDFHRYKNLVDFLKNNTKDKKATLHIHSQGFTTNFEEFFELKEENFDIKLHIDDHPISDIYHMVNADLLIMSNSSFSWLSSLLNSNQKIARDNFMNGPFVHNCLKANYDYSQIS